MDVPNLFKGYLYSSSRVARCTRMHLCQVTHKCQNYDRHRIDCSVCESRVRPTPHNLGGVLAEGEFVPDLQDAMKIIQTNVLRPLAHPDNPETKHECLFDIRRKGERIRKAQEIMGMFQATGILTMEEQIEAAMQNPQTAEMLGRIE